MGRTPIKTSYNCSFHFAIIISPQRLVSPIKKESSIWEDIKKESLGRSSNMRTRDLYIYAKAAFNPHHRGMWFIWWLFNLFLVMAIQSYNSHTIQLTPSKGTVHQFLVYSKNYAIITTVLKHFHHPKRNPIPFSYHPLIFYLTPRHRQSLAYFLSLSVPTVDISYKCNHRARGLSWLTSLT